MSYTFRDLTECTIGTFSSSLLFTSVRGGIEGPFIDLKIGMAIFTIWTYILYKSFMHNNHTSVYKFTINVLVAIGISIAMAYTFKLAALDQMMGIDFFSSPALIIYLLGLPSGLFFEKMNVTSIFANWFVTKKH